MDFLTIGNPEVQASMRKAPAIPVERVDALVQTSTNHHTDCRLYYTPQLLSPIVAHPGKPPSPPIPPRPLRPRKKGISDKSRMSLIRHYNMKVAKYNAELHIYRAQKAAWERHYSEYVNFIDLKPIPSESYEQERVEVCEDDKVQESCHNDSIAAAKPLVVFTHGRNSTLEDAHITAFCQGFGREASILLFEDLRPELQRIHVFRTLVDSYPSIKAFSGRSAGARNAAKASSRTSFDRCNVKS